jgi:hypothetical protein
MRAWVHLTLCNVDLLSGILLTASRHLSKVYRQGLQQAQYETQAVRYKLVCVTMLRETISSSNIFPSIDLAIAQTINLAFDEVSHTL